MAITLSRWIERADRERLMSEVDRIFFESSNTQTFADAATRAAFRERWLDRYLKHYPEWFYVATASDNAVAGYLAGCLENPALRDLFSDIAHFKTFRDWTSRYPAHLHVNLGTAYRNAGIGSLLVSRFCDDARRAGAPGVHVMTGAHARNLAFYQRNGFRQVAVTGEGPSTVAFLARDL